MYRPASVRGALFPAQQSGSRVGFHAPPPGSPAGNLTDLLMRRAQETPKSFEESLAALPPAPEIRDLTPQERQFTPPEGFEIGPYMQHLREGPTSQVLELFQQRPGQFGNVAPNPQQYARQDSQGNPSWAFTAAQMAARAAGEREAQQFIGQSYFPVAADYQRAALQNQLQRELTRAELEMARLQEARNLYSVGAGIPAQYAGPLVSLLGPRAEQFSGEFYGGRSSVA